MSSINQKVNTGLITFTFTNEVGEVFASFQMNPRDLNAYNRCVKMVEYFREHNAPEINNMDDFVAYNQQIEQKVCEMLGYNARPSLFGKVSALTVLPDKRTFVVVVLESVAKALEEEGKRREKMKEYAHDKYLSKYEPDAEPGQWI